MSPWTHALRARRLERLVRPHLDGLLGFARRLTADEPTAEDLVQEAMVAALRRIGGLRDDAAFRTWMSRVVYTTWLDRLDRESRHRRRVERVGQAQVLPFPGPHERLEDRRLGARMLRALDELPAPQREAVWLVDVQGFTFGQAAEVLGIRQGTVASRVCRARAALRVDLADLARERGVIG